MDCVPESGQVPPSSQQLPEGASEQTAAIEDISSSMVIEDTVKRIGQGSQWVQKPNEEFNPATNSMTRSGELVGEIAAASQEQAQGINQVDRAMGEMGKVVQQNAANAEESASASEGMSARAEQMKGFAGELVTLVGGAKNNGN
jgi:methyl-accepting chemotaxis protein